MYRLMRNTHLALGVAFTLMWLMYGVSSVQMSHPEWFDGSPETAEAEVPVELPADAGATALAGALAGPAEVLGDVGNVRESGDTLRFQVVRPGTNHQVTWVRGRSQATVLTHRAAFMGVLNRLHHYAGFWRSWTPLDLWGILVALSSVGLIVLGVSGIYLWFRTWGERRVGGVILVVGLTTGVVLLVLLRTAG